MPTSDQRPLPRYLEIAQHYRDLIKRGDLRPGDRVPSARQLMGEWSVAIATAAKVLQVLQGEGLVAATPGGAGGTVVTGSRAGEAPKDRMTATRQWGRIYPRG